MNTDTTRRALLGGAGLASVALIAPAIAVAEHPAYNTFSRTLAHADATREHFNHLPADLELTNEAEYERQSETMLAASRAADAATPSTWAEFARWVEHATDQGRSNLTAINDDRMLAHVRRLSVKGA